MTIEETCHIILKDTEISDTGLFSLGKHLSWRVGDKEAILDGEFTIDELRAIAWFMENKKE